MEYNAGLSAPVDKRDILSVFAKYGYNERSLISKDKLTELLNEEHQKKNTVPVHTDIIEEIWSESETSSKGEILVGTVADIFLNAQSILEERVNRLTQQEGIMPELDKKIKEKEVELRDYTNFYSDDRIRINELTKELINMQIQQKTNENNLHHFVNDYQTIGNIFSNTNTNTIGNANFGYHPVETKILYPDSKLQPVQTINPIQNSLPHGNLIANSNIDQQPYLSNSSQVNQQVNSKRLLWIFYLTLGLILAELLIMSSYRLWMIPITAYLHSLFILLFGLYSQGSVLYFVGHCGFSVIGDLVFVVLTLMRKYDIMPYNHSQNDIYLVFLFFLFIASIVFRIIIMAFYFSLRNAYSSTPIQYFTFVGEKFLFAPNTRALMNSGFAPTIRVNEKSHINGTSMINQRRPEEGSYRFSNPFDGKDITDVENRGTPNLIESELKN